MQLKLIALISHINPSSYRPQVWHWSQAGPVQRSSRASCWSLWQVMAFLTCPQGDQSTGCLTASCCKAHDGQSTWVFPQIASAWPCPFSASFLLKNVRCNYSELADESARISLSQNQLILNSQLQCTIAICLGCVPYHSYRELGHEDHYATNHKKKEEMKDKTPTARKASYHSRLSSKHQGSPEKLFIFFASPFLLCK